MMNALEELRSRLTYDESDDLRHDAPTSDIALLAIADGLELLAEHLHSLATATRLLGV